MAYQALYRKLRPRKFADVFGQDSIVKTLQNQILSGKIGHAYLFCGTRGTGKTTLAKIMASAVNCTNLQNGEPCGECESCRSQFDETNMDVLELDAASRNGVDDMRELLDRVTYPPQISKYKVYIIDEVHMLSTAAFNALLKTLEEPPEHIIFILATTEQQKIPATILSRCQKFDLSRIPASLIYEKMQGVLDSLDIKHDKNALMQIALSAEGSVRDGWSILDTCIGSLNPGDTLNKEIVENMLGTSSGDFIFSMSENILDGTQLKTLQGIDKLMQDGKEPQVFIKQLSKHFRDMLVAKLCTENIDETISDEDFKRFKKQSKSIDIGRIVGIIDLLMKAETDIRWSSSARVILESTLLKASMPIINNASEEVTEALVNIISSKISKIEARQEELESGITSVPQTNNTKHSQSNSVDKPIAIVKPDASTHEIWKVAKSKINDKSLKGLLNKQTLHKDNNGYYLFFNQKDKCLADILESQDGVEKVKEAIETVTGKSIDFEFRVSNNDNVQSFDDFEAELRKTIPDDILEVQD